VSQVESREIIMSTTLPMQPRLVKITVDVPIEKQTEFNRLWQQILSEEESPINQQIRAEDAKREDVMEEGKAALFRLYAVAQGDTGQCRVIAGFWLACTTEPASLSI
jgi:hypothetical protein